MRKAAGVISSSRRIARIVGSAMIRQTSNNDQNNGSDSAQLSHQRTNNARQKSRTGRPRSGNAAISSGNGNNGDSNNAMISRAEISSAGQKSRTGRPRSGNAVTSSVGTNSARP